MNVVTCVFISSHATKRPSGTLLASTALEELFVGDEKRQKRPESDDDEDDRRFHSDVWELRRRREALPSWPPPADRKVLTHPAFPGLEFADFSEPNDDWGWFVASDKNVDLHAAMFLPPDTADLESVTSEDLLME